MFKSYFRLFPTTWRALISEQKLTEQRIFSRCSGRWQWVTRSLRTRSCTTSAPVTSAAGGSRDLFSHSSESISTPFVFLSENNLKLSWHWRELPRRLGTRSRLVSDQISAMTFEIANFSGSWKPGDIIYDGSKALLIIVNIDAWLSLALGADILCAQRDSLGISLWEFVCNLR